MLIRKETLVVVGVVMLHLFMISNLFAQPSPLTSRELMAMAPLSDHLKALEDGKIILINRPETEKDNELDVIMAILVPADLNRTVSTLQRQSTAEDAPGTLAVGEIKSADPTKLGNAFSKVAFTGAEKDEAMQLMELEPSDEFNFSTGEIALINRKAQQLEDGKKRGDSVTTGMSAAMRDVLMGRYIAYRKKGLNGLAPYQVKASKQISPAEELLGATQAMRLVKARFPAFYDSLLHFPDKSSPNLVHQFYWTKQVESDRPLFVLKHWILDIRPDYALIAERRYYLSHSLNSLQVVIGCFPHGSRTLVILLNQAFTEKVNMKFGKSIAKAIGHKEVEKNIRPIFENLRSEINK